MGNILIPLIRTLCCGFRSRASLLAEIPAHDHRRMLHFNVAAHPTAEWTADQILQAFPWDTAPRCLLRDRDSI
jgi:hypothetical protein